MAKQTELLTARQVAGNLPPGIHGDGGNLYIVVSKTGTKSWMFRYRFGSKRREMGLGAFERVSLKSARQMASDARELLGRKIDPISERERLEVTAIEAEATALRVAEEDAAAETFGSFAMDLLKGYTEINAAGRSHRVPGILDNYKNAKHRQQWENTLRDYAAPIWSMRLEDIDTSRVLKCVAPIWTTKNETAVRLRGRIEKVLAAAIAKGLRDGPNPAIFRGHLDALLPKAKKLARGHHAAISYAAMPSFWKRLAALESVSASALAFTVLTVARSSETTGATWAEIDLTKNVWTIPPERMKAGREHRVPLTDGAVSILKEMLVLRPEGTPTEVVFPARNGKPLSVMAMAMCLRGLQEDITVHGFRSSFRDWAGEETVHPREIAETALAHLVGNAVERAYRRGDALEKRRELMKDWETFVISPLVPSSADNVIAFPKNQKS